METNVEFESKLFSPFLPDEAQVNPGIYGAELAFWLARELASRGVVTSYPEYEDWGWYIEYIGNEDAEFWLHCSNMEGESHHWCCFLEQKSRSLFGRNKASLEQALPLITALRQVLEETAEISVIKWSNKS